MATPSSFWSTLGVGTPLVGSTLAASMGNKEDLLNLINIISPDDTPGLSLLPRTTTQSIYHQWVTDSLAAAATDGATEGDSFSAAGLSGRSRLQNVVQSFRRDFAVTMDQIEMSRKGSTIGVQDEYNYQLSKKLKELARSMESRIWSLGSSLIGSATGDGSTARLFANVRAWANAGGVNGAAYNAGGAFSIDKFLALQEALYTNGASPDTMFVSPGVAMDITRNFLNDSGIGRVTYNQPTNQVYNQAVELIQTDLGRVMRVIDRWVPQLAATQANALDSAALFLFERSKLRLAFWRPVKHYPLAPDGDSMRGYILGAFTVEALHPGTIGVMQQLTT